MKVGRIKFGRTMVAITVLALVAGCGGGAATSAPAATEAATAAPSSAASAPASAPASTAAGEPVVACELAYYTGEFAPYGESLTNDVRFPIEDVINADPPLGRPWTLVSEDIGTVGEAQAARTCLEQRNAEIMVSIAHGYRNYRDFMMEWWQEKDSPLGPSVHGGAIPGNLGGKGAEPIFRAQGLDEALGASGSLYADSIGAKNVVIFATDVEGFQLAANAAEAGAKALGLNVLARIDSPKEQPSYAAEAQKIADLKPDAVIVQAGSVESATLIKQAAEKGVSLNWIGETGWIQKEFIETLGTDVIPGQKGIGYAAFSPNTETPAWPAYEKLWNENNDVAKFGPASDQYHFSTYDVMVMTALAVEAAGSYEASKWAPAMHKIGDAPGDKCYTYADCLKLIREGKDIDYEGVTGPGIYTDGGVNAVNPAYTPFGNDGVAGAPVLLDAEKYLNTVDQIKTEASCDPADPPNVCKW